MNPSFYKEALGYNTEENKQKSCLHLTYIWAVIEKIVNHDVYHFYIF